MEKNYCICLSRVSTGIQELDSQTDKLKQAAYLNGYDDEHLIIIEDKESAVKLSEAERNGLNKMKDCIIDNSKKIDIVIVYELSRIARRPDVVYSIRDFLIAHKVQLQVLNPSFKLLKDDGSFDENSNILFSIFSGLAESEGYLRKARLSRGKAKAAAQHKYMGGAVTFGYDVDKEGYHIINEEQADVIRRIHNEYKTNTIVEIAKKLMLDGTLGPEYNITAAKGFVTRILRDAIYAGIETNVTSTNRPSKFTRKFPAIISEETYREAQLNVIKRKQYKKYSKYVYLCRGLLYTTGGVLFKPIHNHLSYEARWLEGIEEKKTSLNINKLDSIIWEFTKRTMLSRPKLNVDEEKKQIQEEIDSINVHLKTLKAKLLECDSKYMRIESRVINGRINEEQANILESEIEHEKNSYIETERQKEERRDILTQRLNKLLSGVSRMKEEELDALPVEEKNKLSHEYIKSVTVDIVSTSERLLVFKTNECDDYVSWLYHTRKRTLTAPGGQKITMLNIVS